MKHTIYAFDKFQLDTQKRLLLREGQPVQLTSKAVDLLIALIESGGREITKDELMERVWSNQIVEDANLTVTMSHIRKALGEKAGEHRFIVTIPGRGYRFVAELQEYQSFIIEEHTVSQIVVEEEIVPNSDTTQSDIYGTLPALNNQENNLAHFKFDDSLTRLDDIAGPDDSAIIPQTESKSSALSRRHVFLLIALSGLLLMIGVLAFWLYQSRRSQNRQDAASLSAGQMTIRRFTTQGGLPYLAAISPDGKSLAYIQRINGKDSLWLGQIETNSSVPIYQEPDLSLVNPTFAPDGNSVYFLVKGDKRPQSVLVRKPILGGVITELIPNVDSHVTFSPDGKRFAFLRGDNKTNQTSIVIADTADGKNEQTLITRKSPENFSGDGVSWSPDGKVIAFGASKAGGRDEILSVNLTDSSVKKIGNRDWGVVDNIVWLPDGNQLAVIAKESIGERLRQIWLVSYPGGTARQITNDLNTFLQSQITVSGDGKLAVIQGHISAQIWIAPNADVREARRVLQGVAPRYEGIDGLAWTLDGRLLYSAYVGDNLVIWSMEADGSNLKQLTPGKANINDNNMSVTADGRYVIFQSNRSGSVEIWRVNSDGTDLKQLTTGGNNSLPSLSPDGQWVVYTSTVDGKSSLWRISIDGKDAKQITRKPFRASQVSPDGKYIASLSYDESGVRLAIFPFEGGEPVKSFPVPKNSLRARWVMRWTPDSKGILYKDDPQSLWLQILNEEKPQLVKGFEETPVRQLAWSFDGKSFAYTIGITTQEIILIENIE